MTKRPRVAILNCAIAALGGALLLQVAACLAQSPAATASAATLDGETLYRTYGCSACHGNAGAAPLPEHPKLAGQDAAYLIAQLRDFKKGTRTNGLSASMSGYLRTVTDEELVSIAQFLSQQRCRQ